MSLWRAKSILHFADRNELVTLDAQRYWNQSPDESLKQMAHFRSSGVFGEDARWLALGRDHFALYEAFARAVQFERPPRRMLEWGCGGGANAVHFSAECEEYFGVDVAQPMLDECAKQMQERGKARFVPVLVPVAEPEQALQKVSAPIDVFLCTYVFELVPTPEYGYRLLRIARQMLRSGGMALVQIKYSDAHAGRRHWNYAENMADMTLYGLESFWKEAPACGLEPKLIKLVPEEPLVEDGPYAYFCLMKA